MTVLVTAASEHGVTGEIAEAIARTFRHHGLEVVVLAPQDVSGIDRYDAVVLGSPVDAGHRLTPSRLAAMQTATGARGHDIFAGKLQKQDLTRPQRAALAPVRGLQGDFRDSPEIEQWGRASPRVLRARPGADREEVRVACQTVAV